MHQIGIIPVTEYNSLPFWLRRVIWQVLCSIAIRSIGPIMSLDGNCRIVWFSNIKPHAKVPILDQVGINPLDAFQMSNPRLSSET